MGANNRRLPILGAAVLVGIVLTGWGLLRHPKSQQQTMEDFARQAQAQAQALAEQQSRTPDMSKLANLNMAGMTGNLSPAAQVAMLQLVQKHQVSMATAAYLAQAKAEVLSQSNNSVRYSLTFPDGVRSETTITLTPGQSYSPTSAEIAQAQKSGVQAYQVQFSAKTENDTKARMKLRYFIPGAALPSTLQQRLQARAASFLQFIPSAYADGNLGVDVVSDTGVEVTKEALKQAAEHGELSKEFPTPLSRFVDLANAFKKETEHLDWMDQLNFLDYCANNPTNPLTQKAYQQDPNYKNQTLQGLQDARSDVMQMTAMRFLNLATSVATDLVDGPMGAITAPVSSYNDGTLKGLADDRINEIKKQFPECKPADRFEPGHYQPMQGNFTYSYNLTAHECRSQCVDYEEHRKGEGTVHLKPDAMGYLAGEGTGTITLNKKQHAYDQYCKSAGWRENSDGKVNIQLKAGGDTPSNGVILADFNGDALTREGVQIGCDGKEQPLNGGASAGASCEFHNVDLVHGGSYSAYQSGDGHGTCKLEIFPE
ncbi:MAG TPA: hypothetical protein VK466_04465 [Terriglobales bacterium]|nr:hypothetical protein [Terriglobales bacterium]